MSDSVADILERLARVEAALAGPARDDNPRLGPDCPPRGTLFDPIPPVRHLTTPTWKPKTVGSQRPWSR
jgi:hypothetical protein